MPGDEVKQQCITRWWVLQVRKLIKEGKLEEARQMCEEQTNAALGHLQSDPEWRQEYLDLWLHQRAPPYRITFDEYDSDGKL